MNSSKMEPRSPFIPYSAHGRDFFPNISSMKIPYHKFIHSNFFKIKVKDQKIRKRKVKVL